MEHGDLECRNSLFQHLAEATFNVSMFTWSVAGPAIDKPVDRSFAGDNQKP